jgi:hypothetical protein
MRELQTHKSPASFQDPECFFKRFFTSRDVAETKGNGVEVKAVVRERELLRVPFHPFQVGMNLREIRKDLFFGPDLTDFEHLGIDVTDGDGWGRGGVCGGVGLQSLLHQAKGNVTSATGDVQETDAIPPGVSAKDGGQTSHLDEMVFPKPMHAPGHEVIHDVVFAGHTVEHALDKLLFLVDGDLLEAEVGGAAAAAVIIGRVGGKWWRRGGGGGGKSAAMRMWWRGGGGGRDRETTGGAARDAQKKTAARPS